MAYTEEQTRRREKKYQDEVEEVYQRMRYQDSYKIWKMKYFWPFFTLSALYFDVFLNVAIFALAIYTGIAVIWLVFLVIYAIQTWQMQINHRTYRKQVIQKYYATFARGMENQLTYSESEARQRKLKKQITSKSKPV
jgi:hypothetical protein